MAIRKGSLIRIHTPVNEHFAEMVKMHGPLWIVESYPNSYDGRVTARALSDGTRADWIGREYELADDPS
jgi:hypothetical protein